MMFFDVESVLKLLDNPAAMVASQWKKPNRALLAQFLSTAGDDLNESEVMGVWRWQCGLKTGCVVNQLPLAKKCLEFTIRPCILCSLMSFVLFRGNNNNVSVRVVAPPHRLGLVERFPAKFAATTWFVEKVIVALWG